MRQGNHSNAKWALAVAVLVVAVSGGMVLGSNMGFKINMVLPAAAGSPPQGQNITSIPYLVPYADRQCLCEQLGLSNSASVQEFNAATGTLDFYLCGSGSCGAAPALQAGNATWITDPLGSGSAIVVGAHNPAQVVRLECRTGNPPQGDNWKSVPYHSTSASMQAICDEVGPVLSVSEFNGATGTVVGPYFCDLNPAGDINLTKGRAVSILLDSSSAACTGAGFVDWVPNHF